MDAVDVGHRIDRLDDHVVPGSAERGSDRAVVDAIRSNDDDTQCHRLSYCAVKVPS